ncbi:MAG TPA: Asp-tRNA(Asn)/Glu-tRNA(Gln) amidotransferase subunit GatB [Holophagaceae bacterium]|jgi:aspartyl-tRNA(Asn)/glutamyl-tRNA(Gln) amidotransferase subunit B|nr:Asp-tRNA(Asn)/Glu-tRNA(Gln) amidotransferase subunit GatB [Holophagaceae bacterium]
MKLGYEAVIGLEVHVQLSTRSKMFCACRNEYGGAPNTRTCPICLGLPGALPTLNHEAVAMGLRLAAALAAEVSPSSAFYRKQYFYADLPKGYQITQGPVALVEHGSLFIPGDPAVRGTADPVSVRIERAHLEEDAGKSSHGVEPGVSQVDLNRAGVPLLEIVGAPDLRSPQEAHDWFKALHQLVTWIGICDGNMEEGSLRCDANVSVRRVGDEAFGTRVEVKNLNSFRFVRQALQYEIERHIQVLEAGKALSPETRGYDPASGETRIQRAKEGAMDYRIFPEPDLPLLEIAEAEIQAARAALPELPEVRRARLQTLHGLGPDEVAALLQSRAFADYFEALATACGDGKAAASWMLGEVSRLLNASSQPIESFGANPEHLGELIRLVLDRTLSLGTAKDEVLPALLAGEGRAAEIVARKGLVQVQDRDAIASLVQAVLSAHPAQVAQVRAGKDTLRGFLVGQVMKAGQGKVDARVVNEILAEELSR